MGKAELLILLFTLKGPFFPALKTGLRDVPVPYVCLYSVYQEVFNVL
jgi:hypothetical protein